MTTSNRHEGRLEGKVALITGAARGIGLAIAECFADQGANLVLVDLADEVRQVAASLTERGVQTLPLVYDITLTANVERLVAESAGRFGRIDILVNNAGVVMLDDAEMLPEHYWDCTMAINLKAPFMMSQRVGREMIQQGGGKIVNIASQAGIIALDKHVAYGASKAGIIGMTQVLALEWAEYGINVYEVRPGIIETDMTQAVKGKYDALIGEGLTPIRRWGLPSDVARAVLAVAEGMLPFSTGEVINVDGGFHLRRL